MPENNHKKIVEDAYGKRGRMLHLPMIVSFPLLIGLLVLITGVINKGLLIPYVVDPLPEPYRARVMESMQVMDNLTYVSAVVAAAAGLILALVILRPIRRLSSAMAALVDEGVTQHVDFTRTGTEIGELGQSFNRVLGLISSSLPERARFLFHNISSGLIAFDSDGVFTSINSAADKMLELRGVGVRNRTVAEFFSQFGEMDELIELLENARLRGENYSSRKTRVKTVSGREINLLVSTTTVSDHHTGDTETIVTLMDLSRIQQIDKQIQHSDKLSALGTLAAGVAHEIRNPLASLRGLTQLLAEDIPEDHPRKKYAQVMIEEVDRLNSVVQQLLDFSAVSKEEMVKRDVNELLERVFQLAKPALKKKPSVDVRMELAQPAPCIGVFERKMVQAFLNLLLNAIEAVDEQGTVRLVSRDSGSRVEIDFFNSGSYIEPEQVERIFDPFFTTKEKGTGLGLSITHRIIRQHQGDLRVKSSREDGTCFTVSIPLESSAKALDHWEEDTEPAQSSGA